MATSNGRGRMGRNGPARQRKRIGFGGGAAKRSLAVATTLLIGGGLLPATLLATTAPAANAAPVGQGFNVNPADLKFILKQIEISEEHARTRTDENPCGTLRGDGPLQIPTGAQGEELPWGLRTIDGTCNNLVPGQERFGSADNTFPRLVKPGKFDDAENATAFGGPAASSYTQKSGAVADSQPRVISNLIVDQTNTNPSAVEAAGPEAVPDESGTLFIPNAAPDVGLSAPYNSLFTLFGQFFDHGLDLVGKGGNGTVYVPLKEDDPLYDDAPGARTNFMVLTRATNQPGTDGILGTEDDVQEATNSTATFVDQSQTYTSHPSAQVFVRDYANNAGGDPVPTGKMLAGPDGGMATWQIVKQQAATMLGIQLTDADALSVPLLATDPYGKFVRGTNGYPQIVTGSGLVEGDPTANGGAGLLLPADAVKSGQPFLADIAHHAAPRGDRDPSNGPGPIENLDRDGDPGTTDDGDPATYDDEMLNAHFIAGDGRVNENIGLTAIHQIFHSEHNRLTDHVKDVLTNEDPASVSDWETSPGVWNGERIFQAAKFVTEMEYQHLAFEEFARKVQPMVNLFGEGGGGYDTEVDPAIRAEFAHAVYRFGHSMLTETVARKNAGGGNNDIPLIDAFLNPPSYTDGGTAGTLTSEQAAGSIVRGMTRQVGNELDEFVTEALRNNLLGLPLDLATLNMARARDTGTPSLNEARAEFYADSSNSALAPYTSWADLELNLRHRESLVNFVAAYGTHSTVTGNMAERRLAAKRIIANDLLADPLTPTDSADFMNGAGVYENNANGVTTTGVDDIDLWVGGLAEKQMVFGGLLGPTFNYVFELQMEDLQFGDRFYYLSRTSGLNLLTQLEGNSFAELIQRNTDVSGLPADVFSRPDYIFNVGELGTSGPILNDLTTEDYDESDRTSEPGTHLSRVPAGTLRYSGPAHTVFNGTDDGGDRMWASEGDDTMRGNGGDDWMQGGDGADGLIGGLGDDILNDLFGDDVLKGGDGNDALSSGQGFGGDLNQGGRGKDFIVGGNDMTETFAGSGDDFVFAGDGEDTVFGDEGDDWIEGGAGPFNLLQGDSGNAFQDDPDGGHDVLDGDGGEQDFDSEGGDDIGLAGPGIQRMEGMLGFDWFAHKGDPQPGDSDMSFTGLLPPSIDALRDRFDLTEGLSGWNKNDVLRGDDRTVADIVAPGDTAIGNGHELNAAGIARIGALEDVVGAGATSFAAGNIILGGAGNDIIEGRGGDDIIDGDKWLNVRLSVRTDPSDPETETRSADTMSELRADVFAGNLNPGNIVIVREVVSEPAGTDVDTAQFSDVRANYTCAVDGGTAGPCGLTSTGAITTVTHLDGAGTDGTDTIRNIEKLVFSDTVAPAAPVIGTAVAGNASATVNFTPPTSVVTGFEVEVQTAAGVVVGDLRSADLDATSLVVTGLSNGTSYRFRVRAINEVGPGPFSALSNAVTSAAQAADAPGIGTATGGNAQATVNWTAPASDGGSPVTSYQVRVFTGATLDRTISGIAPTARSRVVTGLTNGTAHTFRVLAVNAAGSSQPSAESNSVTPVNPNPVVTATNPANGASGVGVGANVTATFDRSVTSVNGTSFRLRNSSTNALITAVVTLNGAGTVATLNPSAALANGTSYTATLLGTGANGIRTAAGDRLASNSWEFTTVADTTAPTVTSRGPDAGATGINLNVNVSATFSEQVTVANGTTVRLRNTNTNALIGAAVTLNGAGRTVTLNPNNNLALNTRYTLTLTGGAAGIRDLAGNRLTTTSWTFRTRT